jgi:hypothetical protein
MTVNDRLAIVESIKISTGDAIVTAVGFFGGDALPVIFDDALSLAEGLRGVDTDGMNGRRADN